jgi:hypothetical protein
VVKQAFGVVCVVLLIALPARADLTQNFEVDASGWFGTTRVASGTNGIPAAGGNWYGEASAAAAAYTYWSGNNSVAVPFMSSVSVYLDLNAYNNDTRFDLTTAVNKPDGNHRRDFAFNVGFYDDAGGPGGGTDRFVISASNSTGRANSFPKNGARNPVVASATGWYTFNEEFLDNGLGVLEVKLSLLDSASSLIGSWTLSDPTDIIGSTIGGNRYTWFANIESAMGVGGGSLAIDNTSLVSLAAVPEPSAALFGGIACGLIGLVAYGRKKLVKLFAKS